MSRFSCTVLHQSLSRSARDVEQFAALGEKANRLVVERMKQEVGAGDRQEASDHLETSPDLQPTPGISTEFQ